MAVPRRTLTALQRIARSNTNAVDATVKQLAASWAAAWADLSPAWQQAIAALVDHYQRTGTWPSAWQASRIEAVAAAQWRTERSLVTLTAEADKAIRGAAGSLSSATVAAQQELIGSQRAGLEVIEPSDRAVRLALTSRRSRIADLLRSAPALNAAAVRGAFVRPLPTAAPDLSRRLESRVRAGFDTGLVRASTIARTELVDTYRTAAALVDAANQRVVDGWCWHCSCDRRSCIACWVMHGRRFPLETPGPAGHPSCRCTRLPLVDGTSLPSAEARFRRLPRRDQIAVLGPARWDLWHAGDVSWDDLATTRTNPGWRTSHVPRPVADLRRLAGVAS